MKAVEFLVKINSPSVTDKDQEELADWLRERSEHQQAFNSAQESWNDAALLRPSVRNSVSKFEIRVRRTYMRRVQALAATVLIAGVAAASILYFSARPNVLVSPIGEQTVTPLEDGSVVQLNTGSRVAVEYRGDARRLSLLEGEAVFEVKKNPRRPFIVRVNEYEVTALGTEFLVRRDADRVSVTVVEGKVVVTFDASGASMLEMELNSGDRLMLAGRAVKPQRDRPVVENLLAWRKGKLVFSDLSLPDAAAEVNRYATKRIEAGPDTAPVRVGGVFDTADPKYFAVSVAKRCGLHMKEEGGTIVLSRDLGKPERQQADQCLLRQ